MTKIPVRRPVILIVLDGWGEGADTSHNAITRTPTPNYSAMLRDCPTTTLGTSGPDVGLPEGQMGNSEVGHINLGAGRIVYQDFMRINRAIQEGAFFSNPVLNHLIEQAKASGRKLHTLGLTSPGGVHSDMRHLEAFMRMARDRGIAQVYHHAFTDGRDTPPRSALEYLADLERVFSEIGCGIVATVGGRYYAMDRDNRWDRVKRAYDAMVHGRGEEAPDAPEAVRRSYNRGVTDEFLLPTVIVRGGQPLARIEDGDAVFAFNFRPDRMREIVRALTAAQFTEFDRGHVPHLAGFVCMTRYAQSLDLPIAFEEDRPGVTFGQLIAEHGLKQLRLAETEKYAHVTYFFNGGRESIYPGEDRLLVPSPRDVATYDQKPCMSGPEVAQRLIEAIRGGKYDFILCNFANPDMVGHTGVMEAAREAVAFIDSVLGQVRRAVEEIGGVMLVTADHGNIEKMWDETTGAPHSAHTTNRVPLIAVGLGRARLQPGILADVSPTLLAILGIPQPAEMTGRNLWVG